MGRLGIYYDDGCWDWSQMIHERSHFVIHDAWQVYVCLWDNGARGTIDRTNLI